PPAERAAWPFAAGKPGSPWHQAQARLPHGHLQHLQLRPRQWRHPPPAHWRPAVRIGTAGTDLRERTDHRPDPGSLRTPAMTRATDRALSTAEMHAFGEELDAIRDRVIGSLGASDTRYIRRVAAAVRWFGVGGRGLLFL